MLFNVCTLFECDSSSQKQILSFYFHNANIYTGTHLRANIQQTFTDKLLETVKPHLKMSIMPKYQEKGLPQYPESKFTF